MTEENFNSVMRRALFVHFISRFVNQETLDKITNPSQQGIFLKDMVAKDFVRSSFGVAAGWKILHGHMHGTGEQAMRDRIERYVDGADKGLTRRCMRFACGLGAVKKDMPADAVGAAPPVAGLSAPVDPVVAEMAVLQRDSDAIVKYMLDNHLEYMTQAL